MRFPSAIEPPFSHGNKRRDYSKFNPNQRPPKGRRETEANFAAHRAGEAP